MIHYDYLILCTGSEYYPPIKEEKARTIIERSEFLGSLELNKGSVLVVGGGTNGVEVATEL